MITEIRATKEQLKRAIKNAEKVIAALPPWRRDWPTYEAPHDVGDALEQPKAAGNPGGQRPNGARPIAGVAPDAATWEIGARRTDDALDALRAALPDGLTISYDDSPLPRYDDKPDDSHYTRGSIEPWQFIVAHDLNFFEGSIVKYITRWRYKNGVEDLRKVIVYADELLRQAESGTNQPPLTAHSLRLRSQST